MAPKTKRWKPLASRPCYPVAVLVAILLVGANPRWEAPVLNARIRKAWLASGVKVAAIGPQVELTYPVQWLGTDISVLEQIAAGTGEGAVLNRGVERAVGCWPLKCSVHRIRARPWDDSNTGHVLDEWIAALDLCHLIRSACRCIGVEREHDAGRCAVAGGRAPQVVERSVDAIIRAVLSYFRPRLIRISTSEQSR